MSRMIKRELSTVKIYSESDVVNFLEKFLKGSLSGDSFSGRTSWGEPENERLFFALNEIALGNFKVTP